MKREIKDLQAPVTKGDPPLAFEALTIGATMHQTIHHPPHGSGVVRSFS